MSALSALEKSVVADIDAGNFNIDTASDLFKAYNLAKSYNKDVIVKTLLRSLANFNTADFDALIVQLPQTFTTTIPDEKAALIELDTLLHAAAFADFWTALGKFSFAKAAKLEDAARATIAKMLSATVVSITVADAEKALNSKDLAKLFGASATIAGGKVSFAPNNTNNGGPAKKAAEVTLEKLVALQQ